MIRSHIFGTGPRYLDLYTDGTDAPVVYARQEWPAEPHLQRAVVADLLRVLATAVERGRVSLENLT